MARKIAAPRPLIEILPIEIQQAIMSSLADTASLQQFALSCSTLYRSFKAAESMIITQVLVNQVGIGVLPEAIATLKSSHLQLGELDDFTSPYLRQRQPPPKSWTFADAHLVSKMHCHIEFFTRDFIEKALEDSLFRSSARETPTEIDRIQRAFYRFQIYCNMFGRFQKNCNFRVEEQQPNFFARFSVWENEQLACIHEYLVRLVRPAFNDIVNHDVFWGSTNIEYAMGTSSQYIQAILCRGLAHLHKIAEADSYSARFDLIYALYPPYVNKFLHRGVKASQPVNDRFALQSRALIPPFFKHDVDGPEDAWCWAHHHQLQADYIPGGHSFKQYRRVRKWGYVMWDRLRLDECGVFQKPWLQLWAESGEEEQEVDENEEGWFRTEISITQLDASWKRRSQIHLTGGMGWWDFGDEGKVEWAKGKASPWDGEAERRRCGLCIGEVKCAPHRLVLKMKGG